MAHLPARAACSEQSRAERSASTHSGLLHCRRVFEVPGLGTRDLHPQPTARAGPGAGGRLPEGGPTLGTAMLPVGAAVVGQPARRQRAAPPATLRPGGVRHDGPNGALVEAATAVV